MLLSLSNESSDGSIEFNYSKFQSEKVLERLRALDARASENGLESLDPSEDALIRIGMEVNAEGRVTKNSYGVFNLSWQAQRHPEWPAMIEAEIEEIRRAIKDTHNVPLRFLIWAGMGGSAEDKSMFNAIGLLKRGPRCYVLDSTDPAKLKYILADMEKRSGLPLPSVLRSTLIVGMAMGMTSYEPVVNLQKLSALFEKHGIDSRPNFLYMTLPGSLLDQFAKERGYRKVELQLDNGNSTAGRHSGPLTRGSLYPLALARTVLKQWIEGTFLSDKDIATAFRLAAFIHSEGVAGRDKVALFLPKPWAGAAIWTKQDFEESLGKSEESGLKIVIQNGLKLANLRSPKDPRQDHAFLAVQIKGTPNPDSAKISMLRRAGYPVAVLTLPRGVQLSGYMQFIHYVVFGVGYLRNMNFVTQPGVELYKAITNKIYAEAGKNGGVRNTAAWKALMGSHCQASWRGALTLHFSRVHLDFDPSGMDAPDIYAALLNRFVADGSAEYGELTFFGDTRYSTRGAALRKHLQRAADQLFRTRLKMPADVYEGPAMNHSYHEMIIGHGKCFSTVLVSERQEQIPAANYTADYHLSQFLATQMALAERNRPVVALSLANISDTSLEALKEFFRRAARQIKPRM